MEDKENSHRGPVSGARAALLDHSRALRELALEPPPEEPERALSDAEPSSEGGAEPVAGGDFQSENLAELLAQRVQLNADGWYDFDVYMDP